jgi:hypothetical protein
MAEIKLYSAKFEGVFIKLYVCELDYISIFIKLDRDFAVDVAQWGKNPP